MLKLKHLKADTSYIKELVFDVPLKFSVEAGVPLWCAILLPEPDKNNFDACCVFRFKWLGKSSDDVEVFGLETN